MERFLSDAGQQNNLATELTPKTLFEYQLPCDTSTSEDHQPQPCSHSPFEHVPVAADRPGAGVQIPNSCKASDGQHAPGRPHALQGVSSLDSDAPLLPDEPAPAEMLKRKSVPKSALKSFAKAQQCRKRSAQPQPQQQGNNLESRAVSWREDLVQVREYESSERSDNDGKWKKLGCCVLQ